MSQKSQGLWGGSQPFWQSSRAWCRQFRLRSPPVKIPDRVATQERDHYPTTHDAGVKWIEMPPPTLKTARKIPLALGAFSLRHPVPSDGRPARNTNLSSPIRCMRLTQPSLSYRSQVLLQLDPQRRNPNLASTELHQPPPPSRLSRLPPMRAKTSRYHTQLLKPQ